MNIIQIVHIEIWCIGLDYDFVIHRAGYIFTVMQWCLICRLLPFFVFCIYLIWLYANVDYQALHQSFDSR